MSDLSSPKLSEIACEAWNIRRHWSSLFKAPPSHLKPVDGLRALSILIVFAFHCLWCAQLVIRDTYLQFLELPVILQWMKRGSLGVELFFIISGFLIGRILFLEYKMSKTLDLKRFYIRRFFRLMPAYWFALASAALGALLVPVPERIFEREISSNLASIWTNLLYINNFFPVKEQFLSHSWSLAVEEQFYFLWPLLMLLGYRRGWHRKPLTVLIGVTIGYFIIRGLANLDAIETMVSTCGATHAEVVNAALIANLQIFVSPLHDCISAIEFDLTYDNLYTRFLGFSIGIYGAHLWVTYPDSLHAFFSSQTRDRFLRCLAVLALLFPFFDFLLISNDALLFYTSRILSHALLAVGSVYLILSTLSENKNTSFFSRLLSQAWLYPIAQLSYSLYLFHILIIMGVYQALTKLIPGLGLVELMALGGPLAWLGSLVFSIGVYLLIERPGIALRRYVAP